MVLRETGVLRTLSLVTLVKSTTMVLVFITTSVVAVGDWQVDTSNYQPKNCSELEWMPWEPTKNVCWNEGEIVSHLLGPTCSGIQQTWFDSFNNCSMTGARLCTADEILQGLGRPFVTVPCPDIGHVWTGTSCDDGFITVSVGDDSPHKECQVPSRTTSSGGGSRCCTDSAPSPPPPPWNSLFQLPLVAFVSYPTAIVELPVNISTVVRLRSADAPLSLVFLLHEDNQANPVFKYVHSRPIISPDDSFQAIDLPTYSSPLHHQTTYVLSAYLSTTNSIGDVVAMASSGSMVVIPAGVAEQRDALGPMIEITNYPSEPVEYTPGMAVSMSIAYSTDLDPAHAFVRAYLRTEPQLTSKRNTNQRLIPVTLSAGVVTYNTTLQDLDPFSEEVTVRIVAYVCHQNNTSWSARESDDAAEYILVPQGFYPTMTPFSSSPTVAPTTSMPVSASTCFDVYPDGCPLWKSQGFCYSESFGVYMAENCVLSCGLCSSTPTSSVPSAAPSTSAPSTSFPTTFNPTRTPTRRPTPSPTNSPTRRPTRPPTHSPTFPPTKQPTPSPTKAPSTHFPTDYPSNLPTESPLSYPTKSPTLDPRCLKGNTQTEEFCSTGFGYDLCETPSFYFQCMFTCAECTNTMPTTTRPLSDKTNAPTASPVLFPTNSPTCEIVDVETEAFCTAGLAHSLCASELFFDQCQFTCGGCTRPPSPFPFNKVSISPSQRVQHTSAPTLASPTQAPGCSRHNLETESFCSIGMSLHLCTENEFYTKCEASCAGDCIPPTAPPTSSSDLTEPWISPTLSPTCLVTDVESFNFCSSGKSFGLCVVADFHVQCPYTCDGCTVSPSHAPSQKTSTKQPSPMSTSEPTEYPSPLPTSANPTTASPSSAHPTTPPQSSAPTKTPTPIPSSDPSVAPIRFTVQPSSAPSCSVMDSNPEFCMAGAMYDLCDAAEFISQCQFTCNGCSNPPSQHPTQTPVSSSPVTMAPNTETPTTALPTSAAPSLIPSVYPTSTSPSIPPTRAPRTSVPSANPSHQPSRVPVTSITQRPISSPSTSVPSTAPHVPCTLPDSLSTFCEAGALVNLCSSAQFYGQCPYSCDGCTRSPSLLPTSPYPTFFPTLIPSQIPVTAPTSLPTSAPSACADIHDVQATPFCASGRMYGLCDAQGFYDECMYTCSNCSIPQFIFHTVSPSNIPSTSHPSVLSTNPPSTDTLTTHSILCSETEDQQTNSFCSFGRLNSLCSSAEFAAICAATCNECTNAAVSSTTLPATEQDSNTEPHTVVNIATTSAKTADINLMTASEIDVLDSQIQLNVSWNVDFLQNFSIRAYFGIQGAYLSSRIIASHEFEIDSTFGSRFLALDINEAALPLDPSSLFVAHVSIHQMRGSILLNEAIVRDIAIKPILTTEAAESTCTDLPGYIDAKGHGCKDWHSINCAKSTNIGYTTAQMVSLLYGCRKTCKSCTSWKPSTTMPTTPEVSAGELGQDTKENADSAVSPVLIASVVMLAVILTAMVLAIGRRSTSVRTDPDGNTLQRINKAEGHAKWGIGKPYSESEWDSKAKSRMKIAHSSESTDLDSASNLSHVQFRDLMFLARESGSDDLYDLATNKSDMASIANSTSGFKNPAEEEILRQLCMYEEIAAEKAGSKAANRMATYETAMPLQKIGRKGKHRHDSESIYGVVEDDSDAETIYFNE